jgi:NADH dehydrogenase
MSVTDATKRRIVIVGAGFGGLACARALVENSGFHVTLVDRNPYQLFAPLLYQVATGGLPEDDIAYPVRAAIPGVDFVRGEVVKISPDAKTLRLEDGTVLTWDEIVLAVGSVGTTFGITGVAEHALQMKDIKQARAIRRRLLQSYEDVQFGRKPKEALRVVVVGGGADFVFRKCGYDRKILFLSLLWRRHIRGPRPRPRRPHPLRCRLR